MKKRHFLLMGLGAAGAVTVGWGLLPVRQRLFDDSLKAQLQAQSGSLMVNAWITLNKDNTVTLSMPKSEMGQGVHMALSMLVAEEMDLPLESVRIAQSPIAKIYGNVAGLAEGIPFRPDDTGVLARTTRWTMHKVMRELGIMMTGGSSSVKDLWQPLREAAAMAKAAKVDKAFLAGGKPPTSYKLKDPRDYKLLGQPTARRDATAKTDGSALFGIDADKQHPTTHFAAIKFAPNRQGLVDKVSEASLSIAKAASGVQAVMVVPPLHGGTGGVAVVATSYWQAKKALDLLEVQWRAPTRVWSSDSATQALVAALEGDSGFTFYNHGAAKEIAAKASPAIGSRLSATYTAPYLAHATMEPMNAQIAGFDFDEGGKAQRWELRLGTQVPDLARAAAADALALSQSKVAITVPYLGGGFGRRLEVDLTAQVAYLGKHFFKRDKVARQQRSVLQLIWSRADDLQHDFYRPAAAARFDAALDEQGNIAAWVNKSSGSSIVPQYMARNAGLPITDPDKTNSEGAFDQSYEFPSAHVSHKAVDIDIPVGFWRSVGHSHQAFFKESFLDECIQAAIAKGIKTDPLTYRKNLLKNHPRQTAVLDLLFERSGVKTQDLQGIQVEGGLKASWGLALHESFGSVVAMLALVSVTGANKDQIKVHRVDAAIDCGFCVNPLGVAAQVESSVVYGLSAALWGKVDIKDGAVQQSNFHDYRLLRMNECPEINTYILRSTAPPEGVGEPALPPVAPAVGNALFQLTGKRLRALPLVL